MTNSPAASIQARTLFGSSPWQIPMPHDLRFRKENLQISEKIHESRFLFSSHGIARLALLIKSPFIADADRTSIIRSGMRPHLQQHPMLRHRPILPDIEVITDIIKPARLMVASQLFHTIVLIASCSRAMQHQKSDRVGRHHVLAVLHFGEEQALRAHLLPTNVHRKCIFSHKINSTLKIKHWARAYPQCRERCNQRLYDGIHDLSPRNPVRIWFRVRTKHFHNQ
mgnify:CR=1 FL=1